MLPGAVSLKRAGNHNEEPVIAVFYAFARELAGLRPRLDGRAPLGIAGLRGLRGRLCGKEFALVATGIGADLARHSARRALDELGEVELVVATGLAGALSTGLLAGELVLADRVLDGSKEASGTLRVLPLPIEQIEACSAALRGAGLRFSMGALFSSHCVLTGSAEKLQAGKQTGAIAVDMESAALGAESAKRALPFLCVRAVLDEVDDEVMGAQWTDELGSVRPLRAAAYLARNPGALLKLPRMMRNLALATRSLADALEALARLR